MRWGRFRLTTQAPGQVASHDAGDHGQQHQKQRDPKNPAVVHPLPAKITLRWRRRCFAGDREMCDWGRLFASGGNGRSPVVRAARGQP
jgi:hypothetical protein